MKLPILAALTTLSLGIAAAAVPVFAQTDAPTPPTMAAPAHPHRGGGRLQKMAAELNLTDAQKAQIKPILMSTRQQAQAIKADTTLTPDARKAKMKDLHKSANAQMMAILTPTQRAQLKAIRREKRAAKDANG